MNQQREVIYGQRREVLEGADMHSKIIEMRDSLIDEAFSAAFGRRCGNAAHWDIERTCRSIWRSCAWIRGGVRVVYEGLSEKTKAGAARGSDCACGQDLRFARENVGGSESGYARI